MKKKTLFKYIFPIIHIQIHHDNISKFQWIQKYLDIDPDQTDLWMVISAPIITHQLTIDVLMGYESRGVGSQLNL